VVLVLANMDNEVNSNDETNDAILSRQAVIIIWMANSITGWLLFFLNTWYIYVLFVIGHIVVTTLIMGRRLQKFKVGWCDMITIIGVPYLGVIMWALKSRTARLR
jgi:hypothetical protein